MVVQQRLAEYVRNNGIKQTFLVEKTGIKQVKMSNLLNSKVELTADDFERICVALNVDPAKFIIVNKKN